MEKRGVGTLVEIGPFSTSLPHIVDRKRGMASAARVEAGRPAKRAKHDHPCIFAKHFSQEGHARQYPSLRKIICQFSGAEDVVPMLGGLPPSDSFPISSTMMRLRNGQTVDITDAAKVCSFCWLYRHLQSNIKLLVLMSGRNRSAVLHNCSRLPSPAQLV